MELPDFMSYASKFSKPEFAEKISRIAKRAGAKLVYAPIQRLYLFAAPELSIGVSKDNNFKRIADASNISAGGFMVSIGAIFNFSF